MVQSFRGESPWKIHDDPIVLEGYGLFTRRTMLGAVGIRNSWAHPYAQIRVVVFQTRPVVRIGVGRPRLTRARMDNFNWPADIKNIPQTELDKIHLRICPYGFFGITFFGYPERTSSIECRSGFDSAEPFGPELTAEGLVAGQPGQLNSRLEAAPTEDLSNDNFDFRDKQVTF
jgi:hypothetical protein